MSKKNLFRKTIELEKILIDLEATHNRPSSVLVDIINFETKKLIQNHQHLEKIYLNEVKVSTYLEHYGHDGAFDFYLVATIMESEEEYKKRQEEHYQKQLDKANRKKEAEEIEVNNLKDKLKSKT